MLIFAELKMHWRDFFWEELWPYWIQVLPYHLEFFAAHLASQQQ
ncbi:MAG: hypothetical protein ACI4A2_00525 [Candidatus Cryptobacteroides sp.]